MSIRSAILEVKKEFVWLIGQYPTLFIPYYRRRGKNRRLLVGNDTAIVIEGFPRSANTFAVVAFSHVQDREVRVASHLHAPAQVIWAARRGIPAIVLVRKPADAVVSLVIREPSVSIAQGLRRYVRFYTRVSPLRQGFVVAPFEEVTSSFGDVIHRVNAQFGTSFAPFDHSKEQVQECFAIIERLNLAREKRPGAAELTVARPSPEREELKRQLSLELETKRLQPLLLRADAIYRKLLNEKEA